VALGDEDRERLEVMARAIVSRLLHEPTLRLKAAEGDDSYVYVQTLRELFGIDAGDLGGAEAEPAAEVTSLEERRRRQSR
jgi:glutamyl-tRNA reductase